MKERHAKKREIVSTIGKVRSSIFFLKKENIIVVRHLSILKRAYIIIKETNTYPTRRDVRIMRERRITRQLEDVD